MSKRRLQKLLISLIGTLLLMLGYQLGWFDAPAESIEPPPVGQYRVTKVYDGDTIAVDMFGKEEKVRLVGVDTPETHDPRKPVECFGQAATKFTQELVGGKSVKLEADPLSTNRDRYKRLLRYAYLGERLVNLEIIAQGYGFAYTSFPFTKSDQFKEAEKQAKDLGRGLWPACPVIVDSKGFIHSGTAL